MLCFFAICRSAEYFTKASLSPEFIAVLYCSKRDL
jgi:hypothetical protein